MRSVRSLGKPKGGSLRSALSIDLEDPEVTRIRKDFEMYKLNKENEMANMEKRVSFRKADNYNTGEIGVIVYSTTSFSLNRSYMLCSSCFLPKVTKTKSNVGDIAVECWACNWQIADLRPGSDILVFNYLGLELSMTDRLGNQQPDILIPCLCGVGDYSDRRSIFFLISS